jgi:NAD(P)-dependent dehydrogenase (short-subunit alcohol dehydrogenase family)
MPTVVLTGVSRGLGTALFDALDRRGDRILAIGRRFTDAQRAAAVADPDRIRLHTADLSIMEVPSAAELAVALKGSSEAVLIHNAGVIEPIGAVGALPPERITEAVAVNLTSPMLLTNAFLAAVPADAGRIRILFISSGAARQVITGWGTYCATKSGGEMFFNALAAQLADDPRYTVANVSPGVLDTGMQETIRASEGYFPDRERFVELKAGGRLLDPAAVAGKIITEHLTSG